MNRMTPDEILSRAGAILRSEPGLLLEFLAQFDLKPRLLVNYRDAGGELQVWGGSPQGWLNHVENYFKDLFDDGEMEEASWEVVESELGWEIESFDLLLGKVLLARSQWDEHLDIVSPHETSEAVLNDPDEFFERLNR